MIRIEHVLTPSPREMELIIEGMRNPMNSWDRSDSEFWDDDMTLGDNDNHLMQNLCQGGPVHRKYMRMMNIYMRITAPRYWWTEFDTYKVGTVRNSCSTMHKIHSRDLTIDDFSYDIGDGKACIEPQILYLNELRKAFIKTKDVKYWRELIQVLPQSYNQTANVMFTYEAAANMYRWRKNHKLTEWHEFCNVLERMPYSYLITSDYDNMSILNKEDNKNEK